MADFTVYVVQEVQEQINKVIDSVRTWAKNLIDQNYHLDPKIDWTPSKDGSKQEVNDLLAERFPKLAERLNTLIDKVVDKIQICRYGRNWSQSCD